MTTEPFLDEPLITFAHATHIPYANATRHVWGDDEAGEVSDSTYLSTNHLTQLLFEMAPQKRFLHSEKFKTIFAADELYFLVSGELVLANPATGQVVKAKRGEAIFFQRDTWHHGFNVSNERLRVVEYFAPPPAQSTGAAYARQQPNLESVFYAQDELLTRWMPSENIPRTQTLRVIRERDALLRLEGSGQSGLTLIFVSTPQLTVGILELLPGQQTPFQSHNGDKGMFVLEGQPHVRILAPDAPALFELVPLDGVFIPANVSHQYLNLSNAPVRILFGIAPQYFPQA